MFESKEDTYATYKKDPKAFKSKFNKRLSLNIDLGEFAHLTPSISDLRLEAAGGELKKKTDKLDLTTPDNLN